MFQLYHNKSKFEIRIEPMTVYGHVYIKPGKVSKFNQNYYICEDRKQLRDFAKELKQNWINEFEDKLQKSKDIKIKNKYK